VGSTHWISITRSINGIKIENRKLKMPQNKKKNVERDRDIGRG
jgi:hypothetical protein